jgi:uncharacterized protein YndB with AHSA1/START domain
VSSLEEGTLRLVRVFDATPERVFDAWMNRVEWQAWLGPEGVHCDIPLLDARVGGEYRLTMHLSNGEQIPVAGVFKLIERPHTLSFTWGAPGDPTRHSLVTLTFRALGKDQTEMILLQAGLGNAVNRGAHGEGWNSAFNKLAAYLATGGG